MEIRGRRIGHDYPPYVIAELGLNHAGNVDIALAMVDAAKRAGADCVKLQTHCADEFCDEPAYPANAGGESIQAFVARCSLSESDERRVFGHAREIGIECISTPFSHAAIERLERLGVPAYKAGSGQIQDLTFLRELAALNKPVIVSTGMSTKNTVACAAEVFRYRSDVAFLHCTSTYPTKFTDVRYGAMTQMMHMFDDDACWDRFSVGLSDHTGTIWPSLGAVALGASILEVHFKTPECPPGPDLCVSVDEKKLGDLVTGARAIWECRGGMKEILPGEAETLKWFQASRAKR